MKQLQNEIEEVVGNRRLEFSDVEKLKLTRNVLNEAMRLYPPAALMGREELDNDQIGEIPVKKGTNVMIPIFVLHPGKTYSNIHNSLFLPAGKTMTSKIKRITLFLSVSDRGFAWVRTSP